MVQIIFNDRRYDGWQRLCIGQGHYGRRLAYVNKLVKQDLPEMLIEKSVICYKKKVVIKLWDQLRAERKKHLAVGRQEDLRHGPGRNGQHQVREPCCVGPRADQNSAPTWLGDATTKRRVVVGNLW